MGRCAASDPGPGPSARSPPAGGIVMTPTFDPIAPWPVLVAFAALIVGLTLWAYARRLRGTSGAWRWFALGLRLVAILLCFLAALRPSVVLQEKKRQAASLVFLVDTSSSMLIG